MNATAEKRPDCTYTVTLDQDQLDTIRLALGMLQGIIRKDKFKRGKLPPFRNTVFEIKRMRRRSLGSHSVP
jgi:hypothetical protein